MATKVHENISLVIPEYYVGLLMSLGKSECVSIELLPRITDLGEILYRIVTFVTGLLYKKIGLIIMTEKILKKEKKTLKKIWPRPSKNKY